ncbi:MAG: hypothetical protein GXY83_42185 [Rhodopirellula sp.]|nr:hypothetical protein [Rhodopirellula sp.]
MSTIRVLLVGEIERAEFRDAVAELRRAAEVTAAKDVDDALGFLDSGRLVPDLIVVAQAMPGQLSADDIDRLRQRVPLARVIGLLGSWCEGEVRTGKPWPAAVRVYWHQWPARCRRELRRLAAGRGSSWSLPVTASDEEQFLTVADAPLVRGHGLIVIHALEYAMYEWLASACRRQGYATVWLTPNRPPLIGGATAVLFDFGGGVESELADLKSLAEQLHPAPLIALLNFPRLDERNAVLAAGAAAVLSKPLLIADLFEQLDSLLGDYSAFSSFAGADCCKENSSPSRSKPWIGGAAAATVPPGSTT